METSEIVSGLSNHVVGWGILVSGITSLAFMDYFERIRIKLTTCHAPRGQMSLQVADDAGSVESIVGSWEPWQLHQATRALRADYLFVIVYTVFLALCCLAFARGIGKYADWSAIYSSLIWLTYIAAVCDVAENILISRALKGSTSGLSAWATNAFAIAKFELAFVVVLGILLGLVLWSGYAALSVSLSDLDCGHQLMNSLKLPICS